MSVLTMHAKDINVVDTKPICSRITELQNECEITTDSIMPCDGFQLVTNKRHKSSKLKVTTYGHFRYMKAREKYLKNPDGETQKEKEERLFNMNRTYAITLLKNKSELHKTKMCESVINGTRCRHASCRFAHKPEELVVKMCYFGEKCKKRHSGCKHPHTEKERLEMQTKRRQEMKKLLNL